MPNPRATGAAMTLDLVEPGQTVWIVTLEGDAGLVQRLLEFGLLEGDAIEVIGRAPLGDPIEIRCGQSRLSLRRREAVAVTVSPVNSGRPLA